MQKKIKNRRIFMPKKLISVLLTVLMIISLLPVSLFAQESTSAFSDMPAGETGQMLQRAVDNGLLGGMPDGTIRPDDSLTRAQLAAIINRAFGSASKADVSRFSDIKETDWYYQDIAKAVKMGTLVGENGLMQPNRTITKQEAFAILTRAFKLPGGSVEDLKSFADNSQVSDWAKQVIAAIVKGGYYAGVNGKLEAQKAITRAEFASVMDKLVAQYIKKAGVYTGNDLVKKGNILISVPDVTLKDLTINGDLIIGDGVGDGDVILENVTINGRLVVRGGGENSIHIIGKSSVGTVIVARVEGVVRVAVENGADVDVIIIDDGSDDVVIEGTINEVQIKAEDIVVTANNATIKKVSVEGEKTVFNVSEGSVIDNANLNSKAKLNNKGIIKNLNNDNASSGSSSGGGGGGNSGGS